jgi:DNA polymerase-3 subunit gamma/tau
VKIEAAPVKETKQTPEKEVKEVKKEEVSLPEPPSAEKEEKSESENASVDSPFTAWGDVLQEINQTDRPLTGILAGSSAFVRGEHLLIKCDNPTFPQFIKTGIHAGALRDAVLKVTGRKYRLGIYRSPDNSQKARDPLADLINKINS